MLAGGSAGWVYGEHHPLGHAGAIPPVYAIPYALLGGLIGAALGASVLKWRRRE